MNKAFIFSYDAVVALMFIVFFLSFLTYYVNSFSYSSLKNYEITRSADTALNAMIANGKINYAVQKTIQGQSNLAENTLRTELKKLLGKKSKEKITIKVYDSSMNLIYTIQSTYPQRASLSKTKRTYSVNNLFASGDYYGIARLQVWN